MADIKENTLQVAEPQGRRHSLLVDLFIRLVKEKPLGLVGGVIVLLLLFIGIFSNFLAPYDYIQIHLADSLNPPSAQYILGTDDLGRDLLSRIIYGARYSMIVGLAAAALNILVAMVIGIPSGFYGGKFDILVQRFVDGWMCFPPLFIILTVMSMLGQGLVQVIIVIGVMFGIRDSRIVRSTVIGAMQNVYIEAAKSTGCTPWRTMTRHILPNIMASIIVIYTISMGAAILAEATISFLGFGIPPPIPSWGGMLGAGREFMFMAPWMAIWPGTALAISVFGINMLGDAIRDLLDPRLRGGVGRYGKFKVKKLDKAQKGDSILQ